MLKNYLASMAILFSTSLFAQDYFPKNDGVHTINKNYTALTNAKLFVTPKKTIENGTLLIQDGKVVASGNSVSIPKNAIIIDVEGKSIYPSFIDIFSSFGIAAPTSVSSSRRSNQYDASRTGYYWNDHILPDQHAVDQFSYNTKEATELLKAGFGVLNTHIPDGIIRGTGVLITLNNNQGNQYRILDANSGQYSSFQRSKTSKQAYPNSLMGSMALLRQVFIDAEWYGSGHIDTKDLSLEAFNDNKNLVQFFDAGSRANIMRADKVGDAYGVQYVMLGGGDEYERVTDIKASEAKLIIPLNFPDTYDVEDPFLSSALTLGDMRSWNQRPSNPKILSDNGIIFAFTTHSTKSLKEFKSNLLKAIEVGLPKEKALEALTTIPAQLLGKEQIIGSLEEGHLANFIVTSGDIFDKKTTIYENWVQGNKTAFEDINKKDIKGDYKVTLGNDEYNMSISGELSKPKIEIKQDNQKLKAKLTYKDDWVHIAIASKDSLKQEFIRIAALAEKDRMLKGKYILPNGSEFPFTATATEKEADESKAETKTEDTAPLFPVTYPNKAYGFSEMPQTETLLFKNATVWTNEKDGILENTDVLIKEGKISKIGKNLSNGKATVIDGTGKHLTSGIIDEHSHIAAAAINEAGQNSSAEVSIEDVINETDVNIYRNLAGGVTSIQILHGSANPIGGRSAIIKLKWGESADNLVYDNTPKFIKFALGENVKQSNWGNGRFPQTRMGVEQVYIDYFTRAKAYDALKKSGKPFKTDLELEVLAEILNKERFISCHSYVQSEINMLMKVAEKFDFNINTFTHILEGYKVADKMVEHGVGGSTFSDWWAYKFEVNDAIPYNASIMHNAGVTVAINSDDAEMSRRLNQEAAKTIKYGGVSEEEAWKFVTLNPAKLLHLDDRVGSIKVGKDADVVLWSHNPLSIYAKAEKTIIEGVTYFDIERDKAMREAIKKEKSQLINMMLQSKNKGAKTQPVKKKEHKHLHCDSVENEI
ncbi:amidohydrolase family protein [Aestuariibaculum sp. YM273]|uniref:amidohydrolase family protein n=1 Tax=Aestuariibaculum sp. YM273 TaxID=3070659 RepID=UPI0027DB725C|nr:amidohydrolase family protein [Aestuariibaculum sp. YM273]WMI64591.1 amidohydrolase family protein [Aestuariibaculum sp. YM273]